MPTSIIRPAALWKMLGISASTAYRWEATGVLPKRIQLGPRSTGYLSDEVDEYLKRLATSRPSSTTDVINQNGWGSK